MSKVEPDTLNDGGNSEATNEPKSLLGTLDRMLKLPTVETAWQQSQDMYGKVKKSNALVDWAFSTTEGAIQRTAEVASPIVQKFDGPIQIVDRTIIKGIDKLENTVPIIKEKPQDICERAKSRLKRCLNLACDKEEKPTEGAKK